MPPLPQATVEDLDPPGALSLTPSDTISVALMQGFEREYTHLTIVDGDTRSVLGYISVPSLRDRVDRGELSLNDPLSRAMLRFQRKGRRYQVISMGTTLEELEAFFAGGDPEAAARREWKQEFAVVTDEKRHFILGVATTADLEEFVKRRPAL
jgi:hypothetical protein